MDRIFVGVDGGGTRTRAVVTTDELVPLGRGASGPTNASTTPLTHVLESVCEAIDDALGAASLDARSVASISCGLAGVEASAKGSQIVAELDAVYGHGKSFVTTDARIALAGATRLSPDSPGIVLIAGTGAVAFGRNAAGEEARAGGWGPLIGDEGSAYAIAARGLAAVVRQLDGRGPATAISELVFAQEGTHTPRELLSVLYRTDGTPSHLASYSLLVLAAARGGDAVAQRIFEEAGSELGLAVDAVIRKLKMEKERFAVATIGGTFGAQEFLLAPLRSRLALSAPGAEIRPPDFPPEIGAIRLALARGVAA